MIPAQEQEGFTRGSGLVLCGLGGAAAPHPGHSMVHLCLICAGQDALEKQDGFPGWNQEEGAIAADNSLYVCAAVLGCGQHAAGPLQPHIPCWLCVALRGAPAAPGLQELTEQLIPSGSMGDPQGLVSRC